MIPRTAVLFVFLVSAAVCDLRKRRIPNRLCLCGLITGLVLQTVFGGGSGALSGAAGMLVPAVILFPLFALGALGAGDIKLFAVVGSFFGSAFVLRHIAASMAVGGVCAVGILVKNRNWKERILYFFGYLKAGKGRGKYYDAARDGRQNTMHFSVPMALGFLIVVSSMNGGI
ncbi:MAG: prepilin peptidase [Lachnospiraceae bacterium]|nr:prepilin peptidase [Lachnospiraceae bacterium]